MKIQSNVIDNKMGCCIKKACLFIISAMGILLNFIRCFDNSIWGDEGYSIFLAKMNMIDMIKETATDVHPPLYYLMLRIMYLCGGEDGFWFHFVSFIPYIAIMSLILGLVCKEYGFVVACITLILSSFTSASITYINEIRMYELSAFLVFSAFLCIPNVIKGKKGYWLVFSVMSLLAAYTHYYALVSVSFFYLGLYFCLIRNKGIRRNIIKATLVMLFGYLPWLFVLVNAFIRTKNGWWNSSIPTIKSCLVFLYGNDLRWVLYLSIPLLVIYICSRRNKDEKCKKQIVEIGLLAILGNIAVGFILSYCVRPFYLDRYLYPLSVVAYFIFAISVSEFRYKKILVGMTIPTMLVCSLLSYKEIYYHDLGIDEGTSAFLDHVEIPQNAEVYTNSVHHFWTILRYYYDINVNLLAGEEEIININELDCSWLILTGELTEETMQKLYFSGYDVEYIYEGNVGNGSELIVYYVCR